MKKGIFGILAAGLLVFATYKYLNKSETIETIAASPIAVNGSDSLTLSMGAGLAAYYQLKDAFVQSDTTLANTTAIAFAQKIETLPLKSAKQDSLLVQTAISLKEAATDAAKNIAKTPGIEEKRKQFKTASENFFDLLRTMQFSGSKVYQQFCPMAFNEMGATWLDSSSNIKNPYFGSKMPDCGEIRDSIFNPKK